MKQPSREHANLTVTKRYAKPGYDNFDKLTYISEGLHLQQEKYQKNQPKNKSLHI